MLRKRNDGSTGFFEDLPAMVIVIITVVMFFSLTFNVLQTSFEDRKAISISEKAMDFTVQLRGYQNLTHENIEGLYDAHKVRDLGVENITRDIWPTYGSEGFEFSIQIIDVSSYHFNCSRTLATQEWNNTRGLLIGKAVVSTGIAIWVSDEEIHGARMVVTIWK